jgi:hypothetical protein
MESDSIETEYTSPPITSIGDTVTCVSVIKNTSAKAIMEVISLFIAIPLPQNPLLFTEKHGVSVGLFF